MRQILSATLALALLALPIAAQRGGMANRNAPTVGQSISFTNGCSVDIKYRSITWAQGRFMNQLKAPEGREATNKDMKANPTGSLTASQDVTLGGQTVKAGSYKLYFAVDDEQKFHLVLADDAGKETKWKLDLAEKTDMNTRLTLTLTAGKGNNDANLGVGFGTMACSVSLTAGAGSEKPKDAAAPKDDGKGEAKKEGK